MYTDVLRVIASFLPASSDHASLLQVWPKEAAPLRNGWIKQCALTVLWRLNATAPAHARVALYIKLMPLGCTPRMVLEMRSLLAMALRPPLKSVVRYGIAQLMDASFAETAQGRATYRRSIEQIRAGVIQTAAMF